jgi:serine/threonine-protein kinase
MLSGTEGARDPFFSPDGQWLGFFAANKLKKVALGGGAAVSLADVSPNPYGGAWADDDSIVYAPTFLPGPLLRVSSGGGKPSPLPSSPLPQIRSQRWPQMLPGGRGVLFTAGAQVAGFANGHIVVQPFPTGDAKIVVSGAYFGRYLASGHLAYMSNGTMFVAPFDLQRLEVTGAAQPVFANVVGNPDNGGAQFSFSDTGLLVALRGEELSTAEPINWIDRSGKATPLMPKPADWTDIELSPDGRRLAMNIRDSTRMDIWVYDIERATLTRLPGTPGGDSHPVWTLDGRRIAFSAAEGSINANLYWQRADGSEPAQRLTTSPNSQRASSWHPNGKLLGFHQIDPQRASNDAFVLTLEGDERSGWKPGRATNFLIDSYSEIDPMFSPDGKWVAYWSNESGQWEVYVRAYQGPGGKWPISYGGGQFPGWSRTRSELHYGTTAGQIMVVSYKVVGDEFVAERPRPWSDQRLQFRGGGQRFYAMHPDGERVAGVLAKSGTATRHATMMVVLNAFDEIRRLLAGSGK